MSTTKIEYCDTTWSPVTGCTRVSAGCRNCWAERMAQRLKGRFGYPADDPFRVTLHPERLAEPMRWRKPRTVFVGSMGDLFHESVPDHFIYLVWGAMLSVPKHRFLVLTKRPDRMARFLHIHAGKVALPSREVVQAVPYIWLGTSCENQETADERIPHLLKCPAAVRFLSLEPLLGPIDFRRFTQLGLECSVCNWVGAEHEASRQDFDDEPDGWACPACGEPCAHRPIDEHGPDWVIVGGESGPGARPCNIDSMRSIVGQCRDAGVPVFVKQLGAFPTDLGSDGIPEDLVRQEPEHYRINSIKHPKGGDPGEWPEDLRVREMPKG